jgi:hypothetical protein
MPGPHFISLKCSFLESLKRLQYPPRFADEELSYDKNMEQILLDLGRCGGFFPTKGKTFNDYVSTFLRKRVPSTFIQGELDAGTYELVLQWFFTKSDMKVLKEIFGEEVSKELTEGQCSLIRMSGKPANYLIKNKSINHYIITDIGLWFFDCTSNTLTELPLKGKRCSSLSAALKFEEEHPVTEEELALITSYTGSTLKGEKQIERLQFYQSQRSNFRIAYLDDQGKPCGVFISYLQNHPSYWIGAVIRDTAKDKEVSVFLPDKIGAVRGEGVMSIDSAKKASNHFIDALGSQELQAALSQCFQDDGRINAEKLQEIKEQCEASKKGHTILPKKLEQFKELQEKKNQKCKLGVPKVEKERTDIEKAYQTHVQRIDEEYAELLANQQKKGDETIIALQNKRASLVNNNPLLNSPSFVNRNALSLIFGVLGFLTFVSLIFILSGVFSPLGLTLAAGLTTYLAVGGTVVSGIAAWGSCAKIGANEGKFFASQNKLALLDKEVDTVKNLQEEDHQALRKEKQARINHFKEIRDKDIEQVEKSRKENIQKIQSHFEKICQEAMTAECELCLMKSLPQEKKRSNYLYSYILTDERLYYIDLEQMDGKPIIVCKEINSDFQRLQNGLNRLQKFPQVFQGCKIYYLSTEQMNSLGISDEINSPRQKVEELSGTMDQATDVTFLRH